jgi:hypothetical protein
MICKYGCDIERCACDGKGVNLLDTIDHKFPLGNAVANAANDGCKVRRVVTPLLKTVVSVHTQHTRQRTHSTRDSAHTHGTRECVINSDHQ